MHFLTFVAVKIPQYQEELDENKKVEKAIKELQGKATSDDIIKDIYLEHFIELRTTFGRLVNNAVGEALEPFGQDSEAYFEFVDLTEELRREYEKGTDDFYRTPDGKFVRSLFSVGNHQFIVRDNMVYEFKRRGFRQKEFRTKLAKKMKAFPNYPNKKVYKTFEEFAETGRFERYDEDHGAYGFSCNPNTVYDWYAIGGRWRDCLLVKDTCKDVYLCAPKKENAPDAPKGYCWVSGARMKDIEWNLMLSLYKEKLKKNYIEFKKWFMEGACPKGSYYSLYEQGVKSWNCIEYKDGDSLETFLKRKGIAPDVKYPPVCYGYFDDGNYYDQDCDVKVTEVGLEKSYYGWQKQVDSYLDKLNPDDVLVGVDIHI